MTHYQENYEKMSLASVIFLDANAVITATLPKFDDYFSVIKATNGQIRVEQVKQESDTSGDTVVKKQLRETLISQAVDISRKVVAYATNSNNSSLLHLVNYSESDLKKSSDQKLVNICLVIYENANLNVAVLAEYGVNAAMITGLQTSINSFDDTIPKGRVIVADSGTVTQTLTSLFKILANNWAKVDTLVEIVHTSQPQFYNEYQKVRKVIETGSGSLALQIKTINAQSGEPEPNVTITLTPLNTEGKGKIVKKTAKAGGCNYKNLADGAYSIEATKPGFKLVSKTANLVNGELMVLKITMEQV